MIEADIYRHYGGPGYGLRWEHGGWRAAPDGHTPNATSGTTADPCPTPHNNP